MLGVSQARKHHHHAHHQQRLGAADSDNVLSSRPLRSIVVAFLVLFGGSAGVDAAVGVSARPSATRSEQQITTPRQSQVSDEQLFVAKINELRTGLGLEPLTVHPTLVPLAREWAVHLRSQGALSHADDLSLGVTEDWSRLGENVGVGPANQVQALFDAFVASPAHYANLVKPDYRYIGVGVVYGDDGRIWTAHRFMALASGSGADPSTTLPPAIPPSTAVRSSTPTTTPTTQDRQGSTTPDVARALAGEDSADAVDPGSNPATLRSVVAPALVEQISADLEAAGI